jgi:uncharacterized protein (DUF1800 family)
MMYFFSGCAGAVARRMSAGLALAAVASLSGGTVGAEALPGSRGPAALDAAQARHLLLRTGFAPTQAEVQKLVGQSARQAVDTLVARAQAARPLHAPPAFTQAPAPPPPAQAGSPEERQAARQQQLREGLELKAWWLREMIDSPTPLAERMTLFWHGHFATSQQKVVRSQAMWRQHELLRSQALGNFRTLLHGVARDPAMLVYLDGANSRKEAPNENFAREVMELFTLGEASQGGGYTEQDIREAARAFTGWSVERADLTFRSRPAFHDNGTKTVLGRTGALDGDAVLDILLEQPAAARFIAGKLWREFVSPQPDPAELDRVAARFRTSGYDIATLVRDLLLTDAFWSPAQRGTLVKSPVELLVGTARQLGLAVEDTEPMARRAAQLGQNLLVPPNVKGWPGYTEWINATTLLQRKQVGMQLFRPAGQEGAGNAMVNPGMARGGRINLGFDADAWLAAYGAHADREPAPAAREAITQALLATAPTQAVPAGTVGTGWVRALMLDPAYQLK